MKRRTIQPADAEDARQSAWLRHLERGGTEAEALADPQAFARLIDDRARSALRGEARRKKREASWRPIGHALHSWLERREFRRVVAEVCDRHGVPRNHRCALVAWCRGRLRAWAARRGVPPSTARVWKTRALAALRTADELAPFAPET